jgi:hypothetical protein
MLAAEATSASADAQDTMAPTGTADATTRSAPTPVKAKPISGIRLGLAATWAAIAGFFRKLFRRRR